MDNWEFKAPMCNVSMSRIIREFEELAYSSAIVVVNGAVLILTSMATADVFIAVVDKDDIDYKGFVIDDEGNYDMFVEGGKLTVVLAQKFDQRAVGMAFQLVFDDGMTTEDRIEFASKQLRKVENAKKAKAFVKVMCVS